MELELVKRFAKEIGESLAQLQTLHDVRLTRDNLIGYSCLCGKRSYHEIGEIGRGKICKSCRRTFSVPSPPCSPHLAGTDSVKRFLKKDKPSTTGSAVLQKLPSSWVDIGEPVVSSSVPGLRMGEEPTAVFQRLPVFTPAEAIGKVLLAFFFVSAGFTLSFLGVRDSVLFTSGLLSSSLGFWQVACCKAVPPRLALLFTLFVCGLAAYHRLTL